MTMFQKEDIDFCWTVLSLPNAFEWMHRIDKIHAIKRNHPDECSDYESFTNLMNRYEKEDLFPTE